MANRIRLADYGLDGHAGYSAKGEGDTPKGYMGLYATQIFPRLMDWVMARPAFEQLREALLQAASGEILEIGFGTCLNLRHYPTTITRLFIVDPAILLPARVARRMAADMHGRLVADRSPLGGACVRLSVPLTPEDAELSHVA